MDDLRDRIRAGLSKRMAKVRAIREKQEANRQKLLQQEREKKNI